MKSRDSRVPNMPTTRALRVLAGEISSLARMLRDQGIELDPLENLERSFDEEVNCLRDINPSQDLGELLLSRDIVLYFCQQHERHNRRPRPSLKCNGGGLTGERGRDPGDSTQERHRAPVARVNDPLPRHSRSQNAWMVR